MHLIPYTIASLAGSLACFGSFASAADELGSGNLSIGIVFPRNETYAPTDRFPVVLAVENPELAEHLRLNFEYTVRVFYDNPEWKTEPWNNFTYLDDMNNVRGYFNLTEHNSTERFVYAWVNAEREGSYMFFSSYRWLSCDKSEPEEIIFRSSNANYTTNIGTSFTIKDGGKEADLVSGTADDETCVGDVGLTVDVSGETHEVPRTWTDSVAWGICRVASPDPTLSKGPCKVSIDEAAAESMEAVLLSKYCYFVNRPDYCPEEDEDAAGKLGVAGVTSFAAAVGAIGFLLA